MNGLHQFVVVCLKVSLFLSFSNSGSCFRKDRYLKSRGEYYTLNAIVVAITQTEGICFHSACPISLMEAFFQETFEEISSNLLKTS